MCERCPQHVDFAADSVPFDLDAWMARMNDPDTPKATWDGEQWIRTGFPAFDAQVARIGLEAALEDPADA